MTIIRPLAAALALTLLAGCAKSPVQEKAPMQGEMLLVSRADLKAQVAGLATKEGLVQGIQSWGLFENNPYALLSDTCYALLCMESINALHEKTCALTGRALEGVLPHELVTSQEDALPCLRLYAQAAALTGADIEEAALHELARRALREKGYFDGQGAVQADTLTTLNDLHDAALILEGKLTEEERRAFAFYVEGALKELSAELEEAGAAKEEREAQMGRLWLCMETLRLAGLEQSVAEELTMRCLTGGRNAWEALLAKKTQGAACDGGGAQVLALQAPQTVQASQSPPVGQLSTLFFACSLWEDALLPEQAQGMLVAFEREQGFSFFANGEPHLMGTYYALMLQELLGLEVSARRREGVLQFTGRFQTPDGFYSAGILRENACFSWQARRLLALAECEPLPMVDRAALAPFEARIEAGEVSEETMAAYRLSGGALGGQAFLDAVYGSLNRIVNEGISIPFYHFVSAVAFLHDASYVFPQEFCSAYSKWYGALYRELAAQGGSQETLLTFAGMDALVRRYLGEERSKQELTQLKDGLCSALPHADEPLFFAAMLCEALEGEKALLRDIRERCGALLLDKAREAGAGSFFSVSADTPVNFEDSVLVLRLLLTLELAQIAA